MTDLEIIELAARRAAEAHLYQSQGFWLYTREERAIERTLLAFADEIVRLRAARDHSQGGEG